MRALLAWQSIVKDKETLQLTPFQARQAETKCQEWERTVGARLLETWQWALAPYQPDPRDPKIAWEINRASGQEALAVRAGKRFRSDDVLLDQFGAGRLRGPLDRFELWRGHDHVEVRQVITDFATYLYLPRLRDRQLVEGAIRSAISQLVCDQLAYADRFDEASGRYVGLVAQSGTQTVIDGSGLIVKPEAALRQLEREREGKALKDDGEDEVKPPLPPDVPPQPRHFFATVGIDPLRPGRDVGRIAEEVLQHLAAMPGANVRITLEIEADVPEGLPDRVRQIVDEYCRALKFCDHGFGR